MKLRSFKEILSSSQEQLDEILVPIRAKAKKAEATRALAELEEKKVVLERSIHELVQKKDFKFTDLTDKLDEMALLERTINQYNEVMTQLFPDDEAAPAKKAKA